MSEKNVSDPKHTLAEYLEQIYSKRKGTRKGTRGNFNCLNYKQQS